MPSAADICRDQRWNEVADHCNTNFFHIDMERYTLEAVLKKGAELVKRKGIKCLVIDPFNKVRSLRRSLAMLTCTHLSTCKRLRSFAKKYDVLVIIVAHPTKMYKDC